MHSRTLYYGLFAGLMASVISAAVADDSNVRAPQRTLRAPAAAPTDPWSGIEHLIKKPVGRSAKWAAQPSHVPSSAVAPVGSSRENAEPSVGSTNATGARTTDDDASANKAKLPEGNDWAPSSDMLALKVKIRDVLDHYRRRQLNTRDHNPWEVMHAFVAYNVQTEIRRDGPDGPPVNAIGWILWGGRCRGQQLLTLSRGRPHAEEGVGVQGHPAQLLAILAQSRVDQKTPMRLGGKQFVLDDLIQEEMLDCRADAELTFKLISFAHYLPSDAVWRSRDGQNWSIPRIIKTEIHAPVRGAACGGTHRLFGISYAYQMREKEGRPLDGEFLRAKQYIASYHRYTRALQNPDGSFSTEWFSRRDNRPDIDRKIQTTGHITEWLVSSFGDEQLQDPMLVKSVDFLASSLAAEPNRAWSIGPLGHALHALLMYEERVFQAGPESKGSLAANVPANPADTSDPSDTEAEAAAETATAGPVLQGPVLKLQ